MSAIDEILGLEGVDADPSPLGKSDSSNSMLAKAARSATGSVGKLHKGLVHVCMLGCSFVSVHTYNQSAL